MVKWVRVWAAVLLTSVAWVAAPGARAQGPERFSGPSSQALLQLFDEYWEWKIAHHPELATQAGRREHNARWTDRSKAARDREQYELREYLQRAMYLSPGTLTPTMRLSAFLLEADIRNQIESEPYLEAVSLVSQADGVHNRVLTAIDQMPADTALDYENILSRLRALPAYVDQATAEMEEHASAGLTQPVTVVDLMLDQVAAQRAVPPMESPLLAAFQHFPDAIPASAQRRLRAAAVEAYTRQFQPAWTRLESYLRSTYRARARSQAGIGSLRDGRIAYDRLIKHFTTTGMSADQIHRLGLKEVDRLDREMQTIARDYGFTGTVAAFERELANRPGMHFESQAEMIAYAEDVLASVQPRLPALFSRLPRMKVGVRPISADREASTASNYTVGTADGSRQGWFNMNTYQPREQTKYTIEALVLHESVPGHHLQAALAREIPGVPAFQRVYTAAAFGEGWALYAESLGPELGVYRDPPTRFGRLASEYLRAVRLVVDTGIHSMGWTREQARTYFASHVPSQSLAEVDRYIARPGQALAYKIGQLKILELRDRARAALGERFDIKAFHDAVLRNGRLPLDLLEEQVDTYISETARR